MKSPGPTRRLRLHRETIRELTPRELGFVIAAGGGDTENCMTTGPSEDTLNPPTGQCAPTMYCETGGGGNGGGPGGPNPNETG